MTVPVLKFQDFIAAIGDNLTTTSQQVAAVFGKRHDDVLKRIRILVGELPEDRLGYFAETVEVRANPSGGAAIPSIGYRITRDGFTLLAMGFTGKKALEFKLAYIDAFNAMAAYIKNQKEGLQFDYLRKELEFKTRKGKISACAREMRHWQDEKPERLGEMTALLEQMQPSLLN
jgi:Rha family phage regulatory protein